MKRQVVRRTAIIRRVLRAKCWPAATSATATPGVTMQNAPPAIRKPNRPARMDTNCVRKRPTALLATHAESNRVPTDTLPIYKVRQLTRRIAKAPMPIMKPTDIPVQTFAASAYHVQAALPQPEYVQHIEIAVVVMNVPVTRAGSAERVVT